MSIRASWFHLPNTGIIGCTILTPFYKNFLTLRHEDICRKWVSKGKFSISKQALKQAMLAVGVFSANLKANSMSNKQWHISDLISCVRIFSPPLYLIIFVLKSQWYFWDTWNISILCFLAKGWCRQHVLVTCCGNLLDSKADPGVHAPRLTEHKISNTLSTPITL